MSTETLGQASYWGGWVSAAIAVLYKLLITLNIAVAIAGRTQVLPRHLWQLSFLLFLISVASATLVRAKSA